ncbi:MAG: lipocalin-like domain-containing protein, partial [Rubrivivax sp.]
MRRRDGLAAALLALGLGPMPTHAADGDEAVRRGRPLRFPRDHGAHLNAAIEWWYVTGDLRGPDDRRFGFQVTFFRSRTGLAAKLDSRFAARHLLFAHAALTDLAAQNHLHAQRIARWSGD